MLFTSVCRSASSGATEGARGTLTHVIVLADNSLRPEARPSGRLLLAAMRACPYRLVSNAWAKAKNARRRSRGPTTGVRVKQVSPVPEDDEQQSTTAASCEPEALAGGGRRGATRRWDSNTTSSRASAFRSRSIRCIRYQLWTWLSHIRCVFDCTRTTDRTSGELPNLALPRPPLTAETAGVGLVP